MILLWQVNAAIREKFFRLAPVRVADERMSQSETPWMQIVDPPLRGYVTSGK